jgi:hypothetical protein
MARFARPATHRGCGRRPCCNSRPSPSWCQQHQLRLFAARRADIKCRARDLEARGRARATITRRVCTIASFYRYAIEEQLLDHPPAAHVRRPRLDYESHAIGLDRNELGALLVAAGLRSPIEHALISLLALNGLRVSEANWREHRGAGHSSAGQRTCRRHGAAKEIRAQRLVIKRPRSSPAADHWAVSHTQSWLICARIPT